MRFVPTEFPREPMMQVRHSSILYYSLPTSNFSRSKNMFSVKTYSGEMKSHAQKRVRQKIDLLLQISPPQWIDNPVTGKRFEHTLSFITLTISGKSRRLEASEGNKILLEPFLHQMRRKYSLQHYIWKAEFQKSGQLHYHIITPSFIEHYHIKNEWNRILSKNQLIPEYFMENNKEPNSTDIHATYKVRDLASYLTKYISKGNADVIQFYKKSNLIHRKNYPKNYFSPSNQYLKTISQYSKQAYNLPTFKTTTGKIWDCSKKLKENKFFVHPACSLDPKSKEPYSVISMEYIDIIKCKSPQKLIPQQLQKLYLKFIHSIKN